MCRRWLGKKVGTAHLEDEEMRKGKRSQPKKANIILAEMDAQAMRRAAVMEAPERDGERE